MLSAAHHLHRDTRFSYRALARQSRDPQHCDKVIGFNSGFYASDITNLLNQKNKWLRGTLVSESPASADKPSFVYFRYCNFFSVHFLFFNPVFLFRLFSFILTSDP